MLVVHLHPISSFKGEAPHSDTLFGALCWAVRILYGENELTKLLQAYDSSHPPFLLSSSFPFVQVQNEKVYFLPKPLCSFHPEMPRSLADIPRLKSFQKIQYITDSLFTKLIQGELNEESLFIGFLPEAEAESKQKLDQYEFVQIGTMLLESQLARARGSNLFRILKSGDVPHSAINRLSGTVDEGKFFSSSEIYFATNGGLYFLINFFDDSWKRKVLAGWRFLGDRGIGGDVSVGKGQFSVDFEEKDLFIEPEKATRFTTLSLFFSEENWMGNEVFYKLVKRKGKLESAYAPITDIWKKTILMYGEGSIFPLGERKFYGSNPIVKEVDKLKIRQYGYEFPIRMV